LLLVFKWIEVKFLGNRFSICLWNRFLLGNDLDTHPKEICADFA